MAHVAVLLALNTEVQVALVTASGAVLVALATAIPALLSRRASNTAANRLGDPNGYGSVTEMLTSLLRLTERNTTRLDRLDNRLVDMHEIVAQVRGTVNAHHPPPSESHPPD